MFVASSGGSTETDIISECIKGIGNRIFFILFQLKWNPNSSSPILHFFAAARLYIHMVYIMVYTNVNIGRMLAMTPPTSTANSQERWHENREFFKKNVPSVIRLSFLNCSQSRNFKALGVRRFGRADDRWMGFGDSAVARGDIRFILIGDRRWGWGIKFFALSNGQFRILFQKILKVMNIGQVLEIS